MAFLSNLRIIIYLIVGGIMLTQFIYGYSIKTKLTTERALSAQYKAAAENWEQATLKKEQEINTLKETIKLDKEKTNKIIRHSQATIAELTTLRRKYENIRNFLDQSIPDKLNRFMQAKYGKRRTDHSKKTTSRILERNTAPRLVQDLVLFVQKYDDALASCNKDKILIKNYYGM